MASFGKFRLMGPFLMTVLLVSTVAMAASSREPAMPGRALLLPYVDLGDVVVANVSAFGDGCLNSTTTATLTLNSTLLIVQTFFEVAVPVAAPIARTHCEVTVQLNFPVGWAVGVSYWDTYGAVTLEQGLVGIHEGNFYHQGYPTVCNTTMTANATLGAIPERSYMMSAICDANATWSGCAENRGLMFSLTQRINKSGAPYGLGYIRGIALFARLQWKWCGDTLP